MAADSPSLGRWVLLFLVCSLSMSNSRTRGVALAQYANDTRAFLGSVTDPLRERFEALPPKGKFATGAFVGFAATRVAVRTTVRVVKLAGAAFVVSEVMNAAGVFDEIDFPDLSDDNAALLKKARRRVTGHLNKFRVQVRRQLTPEKLKANIDNALDKERMATLGLATGAFVGFVL